MADTSDLPDLRLLSRGELARLLHRDPRTIDRWEKAGDLPAARIMAGQKYWRYAEIAALFGLEAAPAAASGEDVGAAESGTDDDDL